MLRQLATSIGRVFTQPAGTYSLVPHIPRRDFAFEHLVSGVSIGTSNRGSWSLLQRHLFRGCTHPPHRAEGIIRLVGKPNPAQKSPPGSFAPLGTSIGGGGTGGGPAAVQLQLAIRKARWLAPAVGTVAGLFGSLVGVGGGVVIVPLIVNACRAIPQRLVTGTSLVAVVSTALASTATFWQGGLVDATSALLISPVAMLAAPIGARYTAKLDCTALRRALGYFLLAAAPLVPLKGLLVARGAQHAQQEGQQAHRGPTCGQGDPKHPPPRSPRPHAQQQAVGRIAAGSPTIAAVSAISPAGGGRTTLTSEEAPSALRECRTFLEEQVAHAAALPPTTLAALCGTGAVAGFASGLLGIGGGTVVTPLLALLMPYGQATVLGTSLLAMVPPSLAALLQHQRMGNVDWRMAAGLALGTALGGTAGSTAAVQAPAGVLEGAFMLGMLLLGRKTLASATR